MAGFKAPVKTIAKTAEEQLALLRKGYKNDLKISYSAFEFPVRLMSAEEEAMTIANAKSGLKIPDNADKGLFTAMAVMKAVLEKAACVEGIPHVSRAFLDRLSHQELNHLYGEYLHVCETVDPEFEKLSDQRIADMILAVKKNGKAPSAFFIWELAEIGRFFLERLPAEDSAAGS